MLVNGPAGSGWMKSGLYIPDPCSARRTDRSSGPTAAAARTAHGMCTAWRPGFPSTPTLLTISIVGEIAKRTLVSAAVSKTISAISSQYCEMAGIPGVL